MTTEATATSAISRTSREHLADIGSADLVVGILTRHADHGDSELQLHEIMQSVVGEVRGAARTVIVRSDGEGDSETLEVQRDGALIFVNDPALEPDTSMSPAEGISAACKAVLSTGAKLDARACCVVASSLQTVNSRWIARLARPVLENNLDLVMPCYAHHKFEGLLNSGVLSPLSRALYGRRIQNPMGPDLGCSKRMVQKLLGSGTQNTIDGRPTHLLARLAPEAIRADFQICQAHVGARLYPPTDWMNLSSLLAEILSPVFLDMELNAAYWQRTRGSQGVPRLGEPAPISDETGAIDVHRMVESFQLGTKNLNEIWGLVLPPATLLELRKLARLTAEQFRMTDELWARIVYDFALAHRLRTLNRDHLLRSLTPLYLGWVASYALEMATAGAIEVEQRIERLALAYEAAKPYLVSRWRWPDRFSP